MQNHLTEIHSTLMAWMVESSYGGGFIQSIMVKPSVTFQYFSREFISELEFVS